MCHYVHCRRMWETGKERGAGGGRKWMKASEISGWINGQIYGKDGREGISVVGMNSGGGVGNSHIPVSLDCPLYGTPSSCCPLIRLHTACGKCGWSPQWYAQRYVFVHLAGSFSASHRLPRFRCKMIVLHIFPLVFITQMESIRHISVKL